MASYTIPGNNTTNYLGAIANGVEIKLSDRVDYFMQENSKFWKRLVPDRSAKSEWSQGYKVHKIFRTGMAGIAEFPSQGRGYRFTDNAALTAAFTADGTNITAGGPAGQAGADIRNGNFNLFGSSMYQTYPGPTTSPQAGVFQYVFGLRNGVGAFHMPLDLLQFEQEPSVRATVLDRTVDGNAEALAQLQCNAFMGEQAYVDTLSSYRITLNNVIAKVTFVGSTDNVHTNAVAGFQMRCDSGEAGSIARFADGQRVDLIGVKDDGAGALTNDITNFNWVANGDKIPFYVQSVDPLSNTFYLVKTTGQTSVTGNRLVNGRQYLVVAHKAYNGDATAGQTSVVTVSASATRYSHLPFSLEDLIKTSGNLLGSDGSGTDGISIAQHPWAKSYKLDLGGAALDRSFMLKVQARLFHGRSSTRRPDLYCFSEGAYAAWMESIEGMVTYEMNGRNFDESNTGYGQRIGLNALGSKVEFDTDSHIGSGKTYGVISRGGNFKKHTPARLPMAGTNATHGEVDFVGKALGFPTNMVPVISSSEFVNVVSMPYQFYYQICPEILGGMVQFSNVGESYSALV